MVTVAVAVFIFSGKKISLKQRWVMQESISAPQVGGIVRMTGFILRTLFLLEGIGARFLLSVSVRNLVLRKVYGTPSSIRFPPSATPDLT